MRRTQVANDAVSRCKSHDVAVRDGLPSARDRILAQLSCRPRLPPIQLEADIVLLEDRERKSFHWHRRVSVSLSVTQAEQRQRLCPGHTFLDALDKPLPLLGREANVHRVSLV